MGLYQWSWIDKPPGDGDGAGEAGGGGEVDVVRHKKPRGAPKRFHTWCEVAGAWVKDHPTTTATAAVEGAAEAAVPEEAHRPGRSSGGKGKFRGLWEGIWSWLVLVVTLAEGEVCTSPAARLRWLGVVRRHEVLRLHQTR